MPPKARRLVAVQAALCSGAAPAAPGVDGRDIARELSQGTLDTRTLDAATIRTLMRPEPTAQTVTERTLSMQPADVGLGAAPRPLLGAAGEPANRRWLEGLRDEAAAELAMGRGVIQTCLPTFCMDNHQ
jgi:hypothetical protein